MPYRVGVILSGSGYLDGSEIHEAVLTLLYLDKAGAEIHCYAPDIPQYHVINHLTGEAMPETRNVLIESARIARGKVEDLRLAKAADLDALVIPGGYGAAKNLSSYAFDGIEARIHPEVRRIVREVYEADKWILALCIAPVIIAKIFDGTDVHPTLTVGTDSATTDDLRKMGANAIVTDAVGQVRDETQKIYTTPAYMECQRISQVSDGIEEAVKWVISVLNTGAHGGAKTI